ncbi:MAG: methyl-accepting chemotaxis protein [Rhizobiales bacterium]|nr:methyl-accepting chemotaxis protein [Hyphomicrobiales bacterium]
MTSLPTTAWFQRGLVAVRTSLALRWALLVTLVAGLGFALMVHAVSRLLLAKIEAESTRLTEIAQQKTAERIEIEARLGDQRLRALVLRYEGGLASIARQSRTISLLRERDDAGTARHIGPELRRAGFDGGLLVNSALVVVGGDRENLPLATSEQALRNLDFTEALQNLFLSNDRRSPVRYRYIGPFDIGMAMLFQSAVQGRYGIFLASPVFDEFGDVAGLLLGYRLINPSEPTLTEFSTIIRAGVALVHGDKTLVRAGADLPDDLTLPTRDGAMLGRLPALSLIFRCLPSLPQTSLCILRDESDVLRFRDELQVLSVAETSRMQVRLGLFALGLAILLGWLIVMLTRRLTGPLTDIAGEVGRIADGNWTAAVQHVGRADEVGRIARAIEAMQFALIERDRMRQEMIRIDAINQRRLAMGEAVSRFEAGMDDVMGKMHDAAVALTRASDAIGRAARSAEAQADRIQATSVTTATEASLVTGATIQLTRGMAEIDQRLRSARAIVDAGEVSAREAGHRVIDITRLAREAEDAISAVQGLVADLSSKALAASLDAAAAGESGRGYSPASGALSKLAGETSSAASRISDAISELAKVADGAAERLDGMCETFGLAARETDNIALVMAEQDAARRSISDGLASASSAMTGLSDAVSELRFSLVGAENATSDVVKTARSIIADAQAIDQSLRSFVREISA